MLGKNDPVKLKALRVILERAASINPNDPVARLRLGLDVLDKFGPDFDESRLSSLSTSEEATQKVTTLTAEQRSVATV